MNTKILGVITATTAFFSIISMTGAANATSLSYTASTNYDLTDLIDVPLSIKQFDSNLGQLDSVDIDFTGDILGNGNITEKNHSLSLVTVNLSSEVDLTLNGQSLFTLNPLSTYSYIPSSQQSFQIPQLTATAQNTATYTDSQFLASFTGTGNLDFLFSAYANSLVIGSGNIASNIDTQAKSSVQVTYNYTQKRLKVPEPSTTFGIGLIAGLCLLSQKKRAT